MGVFTAQEALIRAKQGHASAQYDYLISLVTLDGGLGKGIQPVHLD